MSAADWYTFGAVWVFLQDSVSGFESKDYSGCFHGVNRWHTVLHWSVSSSVWTTIYPMVQRNKMYWALAPQTVLVSNKNEKTNITRLILYKQKYKCHCFLSVTRGFFWDSSIWSLSVLSSLKRHTIQSPESRLFQTLSHCHLPERNFLWGKACSGLHTNPYTKRKFQIIFITSAAESQYAQRNYRWI